MNHNLRNIEWNEEVPYPMKVIMNDAQTSGGLLITLPFDNAEEMIRKLHEKGFMASTIIGEIIPKGTFKVYVNRNQKPQQKGK